MAEATFFNPYAYDFSDFGGWAYGFLFHREETTFDYVVVQGSGAWKHYVRRSGEDQLLKSGFVPFGNLRTGAREANQLTLVVTGRDAQLFVNDTLAASLAVEGSHRRGDVQVAAR